jgi:hypothetical protein
LTQLVKIRFDESISLDVIGTSDALEIENRLLRFEPGCYAMTLMKLDIFGLWGIYCSVSALIFRKCLETIAGTATDVLNDKDFELAYVGEGRFVGLVLGSKRIDRNALTEAFNTSLEHVWLDQIGEIPSPPKGKFDFIAGQRIWSGLSASNKLQDFIKGTKTHKSFSTSEEISLKRQFFYSGGPSFIAGRVMRLCSSISEESILNEYPQFSSKEVEVIYLLALGNTIKEAAAMIGKAQVTVSLQARSAVLKSRERSINALVAKITHSSLC